MKEKNQLVEIWGDVVSIRSLIISIFICVVSTMGLYFLAPSNDKTMGLFFGLFGAVLGFSISTFLFKPKRNITFEDVESKGH